MTVKEPINLLSVEKLSHAYGDKSLFQNLHFGVNQGDKVALVAKNGTGKSTLMKILAKQNEAEEGHCVYRKNLKIAYLPQEPQLSPLKTVLDCIFEIDNPQKEAIRFYENALLNPNDLPTLQKATEKMNFTQAWNIEQKIRYWVSKFQITNTQDQIKNLSFGQKKRVALASLFFKEPDILFLDEVTNHLDMEVIEWLENFLVSQQITLFLITHDRFFLDRVCNRILELDAGELYSYSGNYSYFLKKKAEREEASLSVATKMQNIMRTELEWLRRQPKARGTKSKSRIQAFEEIQEKAKIKKEDKIQRFDLKVERIGGKVLELHSIQKSFANQQLIQKFSYNFLPKDRIGICGKNGVGKSTLLKLILGEIELDAGKIIRGETVKLGFFGQENRFVSENQKIIDFIRDIANFIPLKKGRTLTAEQLLELFLFPRNKQHQSIEQLSGGEKRRLQLLGVLIKNPNFLILDEPTNDLDIQTLSILEDYLQDFPGCILVVSHDRYFLQRICDHFFIFEGFGIIQDHYGSLEDYLKRKQEKTEKEQKTEKIKEIPQNKEKKKKTKLGFNEKREFERLEGEIEELDLKKQEILTKLNQENLDFEELNQLSLQLDSTIQELEQKENRWIELSEYT